MHQFLSDLRYLAELYARFGAEFLDLNASSMENSTASLSVAVIQNQELISRIEQMDSRLYLLAEEWEKIRNRLSPPIREEIIALAASVSNTAISLACRCRQKIQELEQGLGRLRMEMESLQQGSRYLQTMRPVKSNYPKFIDART